MSAPDEKLLNISKVFDYELKEGPHSFDGVVCEEWRGNDRDAVRAHQGR